jgi:Fe-S cluster biosynthesis and repair protein YggX
MITREVFCTTINKEIEGLDVKEPIVINNNGNK